MRYIPAFLVLSSLLVASVAIVLSQEQHANRGHSAAKAEHRGRAPETMPKIPPADARAASTPTGYRVEIVGRGLTYPTSIEFDDAGRMYLAESGYIYGDDIAPARILVRTRNGDWETIADHLNGPITDLLWHEGRLYVSHRGKISVLEGNDLRDLVTGLPSLGDHHNNQLTAGSDGKLYFGQGTATNSGVVGMDNLKMGWLARFPEVHDVPAKDIRVTDQGFESPDLLALLANEGRSEKHSAESSTEGHAGHGQATEREAGHAHHAGDTATRKSSGEAKKELGHEAHGKQSAAKGGHAEHSAGKQSADRPREHANHAAHQSVAKKSSTEAKKDSGHAGHGKKSTAKSGHEEHSAHKHSGDDPKEHANHAQHAAHKSSPGSKESAPHDHREKPATEGGHKEHAPSKQSGDHAEGHADHSAPNQQHSAGHTTVKTYPLQPFGKTPPDDGAIRGAIKANGTILRMNPDGSSLEVFAWGLRNPFGLTWGPDERLYASDNGYDERGSRPIAHAPDCVWEIREGAWYGFPDYAAGIPVTDARFRPEKGPAPRFLMRDHPLVEKPLVELQHHVGAAKIDFSPSDAFGFKGQMFVALAGDMNPITGRHEERSGFEVIRIDPQDGTAESFFKAKQNAVGPKGLEFVATAGPRRPVDVRFSLDGTALYVVDVGAMAVVQTAAGPKPRPFPNTGVVWRISRDPERRQATAPSDSERSRR
jgi:glucose/arabinose dehydrogenase